MIKDIAKRLYKDRDLQKKVVDYMDQHIEGYRADNCYRSLRGRYMRLRDSYDLRVRSRSDVRAVNSWRSKIVYPLVREAMLIRRAVLLASYRNSPLITVRAGSDTTELAAKYATDTLQSNLRNQKFRQDAFHKSINMAAKYGTAVICSTPNYSERSVMKTVEDIVNGYSMGYTRTLVPQQRFGITAKSIHPLNYWQNPHMADADRSDFRGYTDREQLSELKSRADGDGRYIQANVKKVIDGLKKNDKTGNRYFEQENTNQDLSSNAVDIDYWYGKLSLNGNEDDPSEYLVEKAGEYILRVEENPNDEDIVPIDTLCIDKRDDFWWGNTDAESVVPYEQYLTMWMQMTADSGLRAMQSWVFYNKTAGIDPADINERAKNGGFIPVNQKPGSNISFRDSFYQVSFQDPSIGPMNNVAARVMEAADRILPRKDFTRSQMQGGPQNATATAAVIADQEGNIQDAYYLNDFAIGLNSFGRTQLVMLQQHLPSRFKVRPDPKSPAIELQKRDIIGFFDYYTESALSVNKQVQLTNLLNTMTAIQNFKGAGVDPTWANVNMGALAREWFKKLDVGVDIDEVMPASPEGMPPQIQGQGSVPPSGPTVPAQAPPQPSPQLPPLISAGGPQPAAGNIV